jgi:hypothetical protein
MARWGWVQRKARREGKLSKEQIKKLDSIGFDWVPAEKVTDRWDEQYARLAEYCRLHGHCCLQRNEQYPDGNNLGAWCAKQREARKRGTLTAERKDLLDAVGFCWDLEADRWLGCLQELFAWMRTNPSRVPRKEAEDETERRLGGWRARQRKRHRDGKLQPNEELLLRGIGLI